MRRWGGEITAAVAATVVVMAVENGRFLGLAGKRKENIELLLISGYEMETFGSNGKFCILQKIYIQLGTMIS